MLNGIKKRVRRFLGVREKGLLNFLSQPFWDKFDKVKQGDYASMVKSNIGWVYACIQCLQENISKVPSYLYLPSKNGDRKIEDHPWYSLWKKPNKYFLEWEIKYLLTGYLEGTGNCFIYTPLNPFGRPMELNILPTQSVNMRIEKGEILYDHNHGGEIKTYTSQEITHLKYPNLSNPYVGMGPLEAARKQINIKEYMEQFQLSLLANRARPDGLLSSDESVSTVEAERAQIAWKKKYSGIDKVGEIAVLGKGMQYQTIAITPKDLEYVASLKDARETISSIFGVPLFKLGIVDKVNLANAYALEHSFQQDTIMPRLIMRDAFLTKLAQKYDARLIVKSDNVVPEDREFGLKQEAQDLEKGVTIINEVRKKRGQEPVNWGYRPLMPFNIMPLGSAPEVEPSKAISIVTKSTKDFRLKYWKAYIRRTIGEERLMISKLQDYFNAQKEIILRNIRKYGKSYPNKQIEFFMYARDEQTKKLWALLLPLLRIDISNGAETMIEDFDLGISFDLTSPHIAEFFKVRENLLSNTSDDIFKDIAGILREGIDNGESIVELSQRITDKYEQFGKSRSMTIARTEVNTANNFGHLESMRQANIEKKEWVTAGDELVRDSHIQNQDDGCIGRDGTFSGTGEQAPGEINCRCVVIPCMEGIA